MCWGSISIGSNVSVIQVKVDAVTLQRNVNSAPRLRVIACLSVTSETVTLQLHEEKSRNSSVNAAGLKIKSEVCSPRIVKQATPSPQERRGACRRPQEKGRRTC